MVYKTTIKPVCLYLKFIRQSVLLLKMTRIFKFFVVLCLLTFCHCSADQYFYKQEFTLTVVNNSWAAVRIFASFILKPLADAPIPQSSKAARTLISGLGFNVVRFITQLNITKTNSDLLRGKIDQRLQQLAARYPIADELEVDINLSIERNRAISFSENLEKIITHLSTFCGERQPLRETIFKLIDEEKVLIPVEMISTEVLAYGADENDVEYVATLRQQLTDYVDVLQQKLPQYPDFLINI